MIWALTKITNVKPDPADIFATKGLIVIDSLHFYLANLAQKTKTKKLKLITTLRLITGQIKSLTNF